ncbi:gluconokinase [Jannaschia aquimarina]|uniref:Gluconokinase n=1 Tax=Jannaschia aquimarina TaxID=935700 RepID=A0A0D1EH32_9RHOB|nr:gluconokinase [Jannaschia aquimarina]KIT15155.1 Thermoresistant gluconokinase [Jannaschia aquimarina]SNT23780.1 gluconokinase [Jannaschia aquimarina]
MTRLVVMGVTSTGKSLTGANLARALNVPFIDGDDLHPQRNVDKMARGEPLDDTDRAPWLARIGAVLAERPCVIACSALKRAYRDRLRADAPDLVFVHLHGPREVIAERMAQRDGHFMPLSLLDSQLATLEMPGPDERVIPVDLTLTPLQIVSRVTDALKGEVRPPDA